MRRTDPGFYIYEGIFGGDRYGEGVRKMKGALSSDFDENEIARRRDAAILRALTTPHLPQKAEAKPQSTKAVAQRRRREREKQRRQA